ncbi:MAG: cysteine synthase A [Steroidobacteraceae bacterium]|jgi:cysteine synthase A|nr:cysteine synthase A [Steroidobacteraceae bacterium]
MARFDNVLATIGGTPVVRLNRLSPPGVTVWVKTESRNPGGSVKDRMARAVIEAAERSGALKPGQTVVEATSGNTGIALAMVCAQMGYPLVVTMAENFSIERRRLMRFLGAKVVLTPAAEKGSGMLAKAVELARTHGWFLCRQFENEANADAHSATTAREILEDFDGQRLDAWVTGFGTGGTLKGVARVLKATRPGIRIVACEPDNSPVMASGVPQPRGADGAPAASHPHFRPHPMQGWSPDFISRLAEDARNDGLIDEIRPVSGHDALATARALAREEGIFAGITSGAALAGALALAGELPAGSHVLCMLADTGERYLSTPLFADIEADMDAEELAISRSTPLARFDAPPPPAPVPAQAETPPADDEAEAFVTAAIGDPAEPVVMFALEYCEFCWSLRKLFARLGMRYRSVDLDSAALQAGDLGVRARPVLKALTGAPTIPQVFIAGQLIGGCTEVFDAFKAGRLQSALSAAGVAHEPCPGLDPYQLLPTWLHPRKTA